MSFKNMILDKVSVVQKVKIDEELEVHDTLNPKLWDKDVIKPEVKKAIDAIADNFIEFLGVDRKLVQGIIFTGSNANFNYHTGSDIDIHIELDTSDFKCVDIMDVLRTKKTLWNEIHNITIYGYDVELYAEPTKDSVVTSAGVYSISENKWVVEPVKIDITNVDKSGVDAKAVMIKHQIDKLIAHKADDLKTIEKLKNSIHNMRLQGISKGGEFSVENLAFKDLRDTGYIDKLWDYAKHIVDNSLSLK